MRAAYSEDLSVRKRLHKNAAFFSLTISTRKPAGQSPLIFASSFLKFEEIRQMPLPFLRASAYKIDPKTPVRGETRDQDLWGINS